MNAWPHICDILRLLLQKLFIAKMVYFCFRTEGKNPFVVELGGASPIGCWGYIEAFREMIDQVLPLLMDPQ